MIITSLTATYTATICYKQVRWGGTTVFNYGGTQVSFSPVETIVPEATLTVRSNNFQIAPTGGSDANCNATAFTITFSNGSTVSFSTP